jgi:hypothetical protein
VDVSIERELGSARTEASETQRFVEVSGMGKKSRVKAEKRAAERSALRATLPEPAEPSDPVQQILLEMKAQLLEAKKGVAVAIGDEKRLKKFVEAAAAEPVELRQQLELEWQKQVETVAELKDKLHVFYVRTEEAKRTAARAEALRNASSTRERLSDLCVFERFDALLISQLNDLLRADLAAAKKALLAASDERDALLEELARLKGAVS